VLKILVLISGSGSNLRALLDAAADASFPARIVAVGADNDADGLAHAEEFGIPSFVVPPGSFESREAWGAELVTAITGWTPDLVVCAGFMRILPANAVRTLSPNLINIHPALLPLFPGAHAVREALAAGATETGVTVHIVDEGVDTGPVITQTVVGVQPGDTEATLHQRIKIVERALIVQTVREIALNHINLKELART
jgi:phosphoribosylglycinamide formyltransferase-1